MKLIKGGLVAAVLSLFALTLASATASADPIGAPWTASGSINMDGGLGGSFCDVAVEGFTDGTSIDDVQFNNCSGAAGTPSPLVPWAVTWNGTDTGGTIAVAALATIFGVSCLYAGSVAFTYNASTRTITLGPSTIGKASGPSFPCPSSVEVTGSLTHS